MDLTFYKQVLSILPDKPNISALKVGGDISNNWPLILTSVINIAKTQAIFELSDSKTSMFCITDSLKMIRKISLIEPGQIIFLYDSRVCRIDGSKKLEVEVGSFYTLKEVNDGVPENQKHAKRKKKPEMTSNDDSSTNSSTSIKNKSQMSTESNSRWRTLDERWKNQGHLDDK